MPVALEPDTRERWRDRHLHDADERRAIVEFEVASTENTTS
jgi:hypothetical protein